MEIDFQSCRVIHHGFLEEEACELLDPLQRHGKDEKQNSSCYQEQTYEPKLKKYSKEGHEGCYEDQEK